MQLCLFKNCIHAQPKHILSYIFEENLFPFQQNQSIPVWHTFILDGWIHILLIVPMFKFVTFEHMF